MQDKSFIIRESEIPNVEVVLQREDTITQLQNQLQAASQQIKNLEGDLQTANRAEVQSRKRTEVEKFKSNLKGQEAKLEQNVSLATMRLGDTVKQAGRTSNETAEE